MAGTVIHADDTPVPVLAPGTLAAICSEGQSEAARVSAACALLDRGYGKPTQQVETGSPGDFTGMSDAELDAQIAEGIEHIATHQANGRFTRN